MKEKLIEVEEQEDVGIILSDGCRLSSRIWMPKNSEAHPVPAILEYLPYRKKGWNSCSRQSNPSIRCIAWIRLR